MSIGPAFFRSMSLAEDLGDPTRFEHFRPTRRNGEIFRAVANSGATMVIAPYGSGKSLAAGVAAIHVRNHASDRKTLRHVADRLLKVDEALAAAMGDRLVARAQGTVVALTGFVTAPLAAIAAALGLAEWPRTVESLETSLASRGWDHVAIVWDEFGRHLEGLVAEGRSDELDLVQRLAERAARAKGPTISLSLLLHQNLLAYASRLNETTRTEWRKIEGRFRQVRMVEDSREIFRLIGEVVSSTRPKGAGAPVPSAVIDGAIAARWFDGLDDRGEVAGLLKAASPLTSGALQVLPTLVARVGQNERSLFSFLREVNLGAPVDLETIYEAFSDAMRIDVGIGGTYRRWLEAESARSRAAGPLQRQILAAACLLQLGLSGERRRLPRKVLELSVGNGQDSSVSAQIDALIDHKLLLWRRHNDDVTVWHGADIDVALRVREERDRRAADFDVKSFLDKRFPAPYVRPARHNARFGVNRFLAGRYQTTAEVVEGIEVEPGDQDAAVVYVLAADRVAIDAARETAERVSSERVVHVIPDRPLDVAGAAIEVLALEALKGDVDFLSSDPMVVTELDELMSVAFEQLATVLRGLLDPRASSSSWYYGGRKLPISSDRPASMAASALFDAWYPRTPRIANDQLMRNQASRTTLTARVRVLGSILERDDQDRLGYQPDDRSAEGSVYRTILENTGLYRPVDRRFADVKEIDDPGLQKAWLIVARFFQTATEPGIDRPLSALVNELAASPLGVPRAVMPILIAAGYKRFARTVALYRDGRFVDDLLGFQFDQMVTNHAACSVRVVKWEPRFTEYLPELCYAFSHRRPRSSEEMIMAATNAIQAWVTTIPEGARRSAHVSEGAKALVRTVSAGHDPVDLVLARIPECFGLAGPGPRVIGFVERARKEIDAVQDVFASLAAATAADVFRVRDGDEGLIAAVSAWSACFDLEAMETRSDLRISDRSVLRKAVETANDRFSPKSFVGALSSILLQRGLERWDDRTEPQFRTALRECRERLEAAALDTERPMPELRPIIAARMTDLQTMLAQIDRRPAAPVASAIKTIGARQ